MEHEPLTTSARDLALSLALCLDRREVLAGQADMELRRLYGMALDLCAALRDDATANSPSRL